MIVGYASSTDFQSMKLKLNEAKQLEPRSKGGNFGLGLRAEAEEGTRRLEERV